MSDIEKKEPDMKKGCLKSLGFLVLMFCIGGGIAFIGSLIPSTKIDPCECIKISSKKDLGLSYNESDWNKCVDTYYSVDNLFTECVSK